MVKLELTPEPLDLSAIGEIIAGGAQLSLSTGASERIRACRAFLEEKLSSGDHIYYGINTGFGALYNKRIPEGDTRALQTNLIRSHACGTGEEVPGELVRLMLLLKAHGLGLGHSGVRLELVRRLIDFYNHEVLPVVYQQGSLGASGDLAPLAHLSLPLIGEGEVHYKGKRQAAASVLGELGWKPLQLEAKEGLALLNGTQFMTAYGIHALFDANRLSAAAARIAALSLDVFDGRAEAFHPAVHGVRPHAGQGDIARRVREWLEGSELIARPKKHVQDPYAFRCIPQVHGASADTIGYVSGVFETEINSVTDNPTLFPEENLVISAGNFHGQPLALALDFLAIAMAELGSISERRTYQLLSGQRGLPVFLAREPGLHSGLMIPQYTAASLVSQNKQLCTPASVDSIVSSNGQEDHVSMGANAATKLIDVNANVERILAIELLTAAQGLEFRRPLRSSPAQEQMVEAYREEVSFMAADRQLSVDIARSVDFLRTYGF